MYARADLEVDFCKHDLYSQLKVLAELGNHGLTSRLCKARKMSFYLYNPSEKGVNLFNAEKPGSQSVEGCGRWNC